MKDIQVVIAAQLRNQLRKAARQAAKRGDRAAAIAAITKLRQIGGRI